jgi:hypothetical protein
LCCCLFSLLLLLLLHPPLYSAGFMWDRWHWSSNDFFGRSPPNAIHSSVRIVLVDFYLYLLLSAIVSFVRPAVYAEKAAVYTIYYMPGEHASAGQHRRPESCWIVHGSIGMCDPQQNKIDFYCSVVCVMAATSRAWHFSFVVSISYRDPIIIFRIVIITNASRKSTTMSVSLSP